MGWQDKTQDKKAFLQCDPYQMYQPLFGSL